MFTVEELPLPRDEEPYQPPEMSSERQHPSSEPPTINTHDFNISPNNPQTQMNIQANTVNISNTGDIRAEEAGSEGENYDVIDTEDFLETSKDDQEKIMHKIIKDGSPEMLMALKNMIDDRIQDPVVGNSKMTDEHNHTIVHKIQGGDGDRTDPKQTDDCFPVIDHMRGEQMRGLPVQESLSYPIFSETCFSQEHFPTMISGNTVTRERHKERYTQSDLTEDGRSESSSNRQQVSEAATKGIKTNESGSGPTLGNNPSDHRIQASILILFSVSIFIILCFYMYQCILQINE